MEETIRRVITNALNGISLSAPVTKITTTNLQITESLSDLPYALLTSLDEI